jgi:hypothetical protein
MHLQRVYSDRLVQLSRQAIYKHSFHSECVVLLDVLDKNPIMMTFRVVQNPAAYVFPLTSIGVHLIITEIMFCSSN